MPKKTQQWGLVKKGRERHLPHEDKWSLGDIERRKEKQPEEGGCYNDRLEETARLEMLELRD